MALDRARNRLVVADPTQDTVTQVAVGLGYAHVGLRVKNSYQPGAQVVQPRLAVGGSTRNRKTS